MKFLVEERMNNRISSLRFKDVNFAYVDNKNIFSKNICVEFSVGKINVVTGENGCGKSTLLNLSLGIWDNYSGAIYLDEKNINSYSKEHLRDLISYGFQMPAVVRDTFLNNIVWGTPINKKRIEYFINAVKLSDDIAKKPQQLLTVINRNNLSQGQLQKLEIIRVLYKDSPVMIFDEPTSNLDVESVRSFIKLLKVMQEKYLLIVISHDDRIISTADYQFAL